MHIVGLIKDTLSTQRTLPGKSIWLLPNRDPHICYELQPKHIIWFQLSTSIQDKNPKKWNIENVNTFLLPSFLLPSLPPSLLSFLPWRQRYFHFSLAHEMVFARKWHYRFLKLRTELPILSSIVTESFLELKRSDVNSSTFV